MGSDTAESNSFSDWLLRTLMPHCDSATVVGQAILMLHRRLNSKPLYLNAACPAWRTAYSHSVVRDGWYPFDTAMQTQQLKQLNGYVEALTELAPNMGAYIDEADSFQEKLS